MQMEIKCAGVTLTPSLIFFFTLFIWNLEGGGGSMICINVVVIWVVGVTNYFVAKEIPCS
jgi:hypothetical protein